MKFLVLILVLFSLLGCTTPSTNKEAPREKRDTCTDRSVVGVLEHLERRLEKVFQDKEDQCAKKVKEEKSK